MPKDTIPIYLKDHLAGATLATEIVERLIRQNQGEPLGTFAIEILARIEEDERELIRLLKKFGWLPGIFKKFAAWTAAKMTVFKLGKTTGQFGNFQALEMLSVGILGKRSLWKALQEVRSTDERLQTLDYDRLITRAENQFSDVEQFRIQLARTTLTSKPI